MKNLRKPLLYLLFFEILILITGFFITKYIPAGLKFGEITVVSGGFTIIAILVLIIFFRGQTKEPSRQTMHSLVAISLKLLIDLIFAFGWIFIAKKTGLPAVLLFFVLYLLFTLFIIIAILKILKNKSL